MTWDELKAAVDSELVELGRDGDIPIRYIDIGYCDGVTVILGDNGDLEILD